MLFFGAPPCRLSRRACDCNFETPALARPPCSLEDMCSPHSAAAVGVRLCRWHARSPLPPASSRPPHARRIRRSPDPDPEPGGPPPGGPGLRHPASCGCRQGTGCRGTTGPGGARREEMARCPRSLSSGPTRWRWRPRISRGHRSGWGRSGFASTSGSPTDWPTATIASVRRPTLPARHRRGCRQRGACTTSSIRRRASPSWATTASGGNRSGLRSRPAPLRPP